MPPLYTTPFARDGFPAPDTREIDGRTADGAGDGALALGTLDRDPTTLEGNSLGVSTQGVVTEGAAQSYARDLDNPIAKYKWNGLTGLPMDAHRVEMTPTFPAHDDPPVSGNCGLTSGAAVLHDTGVGSDVDNIDGETLTGGGATWQTALLGSTASLQRINNEFTGDPTPGNGGDGSAIAVGSSLPDEGDYRVRVKGYFTAFQNEFADNTPQSFSALLRWADNNTGDIFKTGGFVATFRTAPLDGANKYRIDIAGGTSILIAGTLSLATEYTLDVTISGRGFICARVYDGATLKGTAASTVAILPARRYAYPFSPGLAVLSQYVDGTHSESGRTVYVTDFEVLPIVEDPPITGGISNEDARNDVAVRVSADGLTGYFSRQYFDHFDVDPERYYEVGWRDAGVETILWRQTDHGAAFTSAHDTPYPFSLAIDPSNILHAYDGDTELVAHELGVDLADDTSDVVPIFDAADTTPGFGGFDAAGFGFTDRPTSVTVYAESEVECAPGTGGEGEPECIPCIGPPENPYPPNPPPEPPPPPPYIFQRQDTVWRATLAPSALYPDSTRTKGYGALRPGLNMAMRQLLTWRFPTPPVEENPPPPDTPLPPFYDPCDLLGPFPEPPSVPLGPPPDRIYICGQMPATRISLFTCASRALGPWSPGELNQASARGGYLQGAQGSYSKFLDPNYNESLYFDWVDSHLGYLPAMIARPEFVGLQFIDDWASSVRWPPSGISVAQMSRQTAYWKLRYGANLRLVARARPSQWVGAYPSNIDAVMCQYSYWAVRGMTPAQFRDSEMSIAISRGWLVELVINLTNGGRTQGQQMTPDEVEEALVAFAAFGQNLLGTGVGFTYNSAWADNPLYLDPLAAGRNALAALGPP